MKKLIFSVIFVLAIVPLSACGINSEGYQSEDEEIAEIANVSSRFTREQFLEDFDFFVEFLREHHPHLGVINRRLGVDFMQIAQELRPTLEDENFELNEEIFTQIMLDNFFMNPRLNGHTFAHAHFNLMSFTEEFDNSVDNIQTSIIEPGRIGYIKIHEFDFMGAERRETIFNFFKETVGFEHIIIDIRGNIGGQPHFFEDAIIAPNITESFTQTFHAFSTSSELSIEFLNVGHSVMSDPNMGYFMRFADSPVLEFSEMPELPYLNEEDAANFTYGFTFSRNLTPIVQDFPPFEGQIWLLIDGRVSSAANMFSSIAREMDFATLVGEPTNGDSTFVIRPAGFSPRLPNTNISFQFDTTYNTDALGRAIDEYVTQPHIFNNDGMDALETVLSIIR
ncbi:MAG: S41 family peptidase [Defluviitaleaceae bacterium]|nr:S41 family peptidase [Defluviitaleaceae bacterium]